MRIVFLGGGDDGRGLLLAGVSRAEVIDAHALARSLSELSSQDPPPGLVLVAAEVADLSRAALAAFERRCPRSSVVVLPGSAVPGGGADARAG